LIKASDSLPISAPVDGGTVSPDSDLSDGAAEVVVAAGVGSFSFSGLLAETEYFFEIFPYTDSGPVD
jgi:hypothetical protein